MGLRDAHDPPEEPAGRGLDDPGRNPSFPGGLPFTVGIGCDFTASPMDGYTVSVSVPSIAGVVF